MSQIIDDRLVSTSTGHAIIKCKTGSCKAVRRIEFTLTTTTRAYEGRPSVTQAVNVSGREKRIGGSYGIDWALFDLAGRCHACEGPVIVRKIKGVHVADKPCNARCLGATGDTCECTCAGMNHGSKFDH